MSDQSIDGDQGPGDTLLVDIVSDVVCPWCVIGFKHFERALGAVGAAARIRWRAFELNPDMGPDGEDAAEHVARKYGASAEKHAAAQAEIAALGEAVGFTFTPGPSRMRNTFRAHQLLRWAGTLGAKHTVKLALFKAHFTERRNVDDPVVLTEIAAEAGLDRAAAAEALGSGTYAKAVRDEQNAFRQLEVSGVPTFILNQRHMMIGAQPPEMFEKALRKLGAGASEAEH